MINPALFQFGDITERLRKVVEEQATAEERAALALIRRILKDPDIKPPASSDEARALLNRVFDAGFEIHRRGLSLAAVGSIAPRTELVAYKRVEVDKEAVVPTPWQMT